MVCVALYGEGNYGASNNLVQELQLDDAQFVAYFERMKFSIWDRAVVCFNRFITVSIFEISGFVVCF